MISAFNSNAEWSFPIPIFIFFSFSFPLYFIYMLLYNKIDFSIIITNPAL